MPPKCTVRYGTSIMPFFAKLLDALPPTPSDFANSRLFPAENRIAEAPELKDLKRPSLSAILSAISDQKALYLWQKAQIEEMGLSAFKSSMYERMALGTQVHSRVEELLKVRSGKGRRSEQDLLDIIKKERLVELQNYMKSALPLILEIQNPSTAISEKKVRHPTLAYQGRFDAVVQYRDEWSILDWKTAPARSSFSKLGEDSLSYTSYVRQLAAYASAYNHDIRFETLPIVKSGLLVSLKEDGSPAEVFRVGQEEMEKTFRDVTEKLEEFWTKVANAGSPTLDLAYKPPKTN